jgi:hypothetical protein
VKLPQEQIRLLIKDRSSLNAQLLPLLEVDAHREAVQAASTELADLLRSRVPSNCDLMLRRLATAIATARPVHLNVYQGQSAPTDGMFDMEDEISDGEDAQLDIPVAVTAHHGQKSAMLTANQELSQQNEVDEQRQQYCETPALGENAPAGQRSSVDEPEMLRDATPSISGQASGSAIGSVPGDRRQLVVSLTPDTRHTRGKSAENPEDGTAIADFDEMDDLNALPDFEMPFPDEEDVEDDDGNELADVLLPAAGPADEQSLNPHTISTLRRMEQLAMVVLTDMAFLFANCFRLFCA